MPGSIHVPVLARTDRLSALHLITIAAIDAGYGATFLFGGKAESASQLLLRPILPPPLWGGILVVAAIGLWMGWNRGAPVLGLLVWGGLAAASAITIIAGTATSYGGPWLFLGFAALHGVVFWGEESGRDTGKGRSA